MALSMDEQRVLAEIERRLAAEEPRLAASLTSFRRPGAAAVLRAPRSRIIGSLLTVTVVAVISMMVYVIVPFRGHSARTPTEPAQTVTTASANGPGAAEFSSAPSAGNSAVTGVSAQANAKATGASRKPASGATAHGKAASGKASDGTTASGTAQSGSTASGSTATGSASGGTQAAKPEITGFSLPR
jgi:hypothetical protein